jgi:hypothetical protein
MAERIYYAREYGWYSRWKIVNAGNSTSADDPTPRTMYQVSTDAEWPGHFKRESSLYYTREEALESIRRFHPDLTDKDPNAARSAHNMYVRW